MWAYNKDFWRERTEDQRRILLEEAGAAFIRSAILYLENTEAASEQGVAEHGVQFLEPNEELRQAHERFIEEDAAALVQNAQDAYGVTEEQAVELIGTFSQLVAEWEERLEGIDWKDKEKLTEIFLEEIYKKVDVTKHGM
jgi:TRAP-type transport system periplasmic protein